MPRPSRLDALRSEFEEFQENSRELEAELETSLEQTEGKNKDLLAKLLRLEEENNSLKVREREERGRGEREGGEREREGRAEGGEMSEGEKGYKIHDT